MTKYITKQDGWNFFFCYLGAQLGALIHSVIITRDYQESLVETWYFLIIGLPVIFPVAGIYFLYLLSARLILSQIRIAWMAVCCLTLYGFACLLGLVAYRWAEDQGRYHSFGDYISQVNFYFVFAVIGIVQINCLLSKYIMREL